MKKATILGLAFMLPFTLAANSECGARGGKEPITSTTDKDGKCKRKKLAGVGGLEKQDPDPTKLGCDERILYFFVVASGTNKLRITIRHDAWGKKTLHDEESFPTAMGHIADWEESVVTYKDRKVTLTATTNNRLSTDGLGVYIYDYPKPWTIKGPICAKTISREQMHTQHGEVECVAPPIAIK